MQILNLLLNHLCLPATENLIRSLVTPVFIVLIIQSVDELFNWVIIKDLESPIFASKENI